jgi:hypothetical protein
LNVLLGQNETFVIFQVDVLHESEVIQSLLSLSNCHSVLLTSTTSIGQLHISLPSVAKLLFSKAHRENLAHQFEQSNSSDLKQVSYFQQHRPAEINNSQALAAGLSTSRFIIVSFRISL